MIFSIKEYPENPILIINDNLLYPEGWLDMFINDHRKYPNDIIAGSIQYFFGKNLKINQFSEGYKGKYFGIFNHISNMIFNFGIINTNLGGTLFPSHSFKNKYFFNLNYFLKISNNSDEFWQSCFIMIENKILRQSSKIFDYTEYLINHKILINKKKLFENIKQKFINYYPNFTKIVELRQQKIIVSFTSYYKRFGFLTNVIQSIKQQTLLPKKILLVLYKDDFYKYKLNLTGIEIIKVNKDIKSHKKYFYSMINYRDYAIITLDDDIFYPSDTILSIYESYIKHPNIISGRRSHLMRYKKNNELKKYANWIIDQKIVNGSDYNIFITTGAGAIYPPDILNIKEKHLNLINEVITTDDIILKYFEINKGIESIWVPNKLTLGMNIKNITSKVINTPLYNINIILNDININKINIDISNKIIINCCVQYKNIKTGLIIYLFNIDNIFVKNNDITIFNIEAYSFCPINNNIKFQIYFGNYIADCFFNNNFSIIKQNSIKIKTKKILKATCSINKTIINFEDYYFPDAQSKTIKNIYIYNKRMYLTIIFKDFYCINKYKCYMTSFFYKNRNKGYKINVKIFNNFYLCILNNDVIYLNNNIPIIGNFKCIKKFFYNTFNKHFIGGIPKVEIKNKTNDFPNQFFISRIIINNDIGNYTRIIIKGKLYENLKKNLNDLIIHAIYPKLDLICNLKNSTNYIQSNIYCYAKCKINKTLLIENQIIYSKDYKESLLLINKLTLYQNYEIINIHNNLYIKPITKFKLAYFIYSKIIYLILLILLFIKIKRFY